MHILFAGGGTAGHINPALAVAGYLKKEYPDIEISYIGTAKKLEAKLVPEAGYDFYTIDVAGLQRRLTPKNVLRNIIAVEKMFTSSIKARKYLKELKPDVVVGTGGYVSGPVLREAAKLGIKTAIHEQNAFPGITTKALAPKVDMVMLAMKEAEKHLKLNKKPIITGNPVRQELLEISKEEAKKALGLDNRPLILSFGGSLGARPINQAVAGLIASHNGSKKYYHIHGTGKVGFESTKKLIEEKCGELAREITVREYIDDMNVCMAAADIVICRAGAITLSEIQACAKASVLIPSPYVAENHQYHNAMALKNVGAAEVIEEKDLKDDILIKKVTQLLENPDMLKSMEDAALKSAITNANQRIAKVVTDLYEQK